jgi:amino acid adenylation domain-containing protein
MSTSRGNEPKGTDPRADAPSFACVHQRFEQIAHDRPDAIAVRDTTHALTYAELNARANRLAHRLRLNGVGPEVLVGLCVPRGCELVAGALGILKAGGAYVAFDAGHASTRLACMAEDAGLEIVVASASTAHLCGDRARTVLIDERYALASFSDANPGVGGDERGLAYAVYTSGSTGKPKASLLEHRGLVNMAREQARIFAVGGESRVLQFASFAFDAATFEWVMALANGAELCVPDDATVKSPAALTRFVTRCAVTHATLPPVLLPLLDRGAWQGVGTLIVAGEAVSRELAEEWSAERAFFNAYGPSEMTVWSTTGRFMTGQPIVHIGTPIAHSACHVLDAAGEPVAVGEVGELHLAGVGIARGYLNRPDLTAERFVVNPFSPGLSPRMFRSGDRVRVLESGDLEFVGRVDRQLKIRGHRVEPEEIERCIAAHPAVTGAAVEPHSWAGTTRLVAYVTVDPEFAANGAQAERNVAQWREVFDRAYRGMPLTAARDGVDRAAAFADFTGWHSSFTRAAIPADSMHDWLDATVARIRALAPRRILEVGCGAGLLLNRLVGECECYVATDLSTEVLARLRANLPLLGDDARKVELYAPDEAERALGARRFDTVIVNSVIHYFPHEAHLRAQLAGLFGRLTPGGALFVGDVRHLGWLERFYADVERHHSGQSEGFDVRVRARVRNDKELVVAPELFLDAARSMEGVGGVELMPKLGRHGNEMNVYRYDVVLRCAADAAVPVPPTPRELDWATLNSIAAVEAQLRAGLLEEGSAVIIRGVPYSRLAEGGADPVEWPALASRHGAEAELALGVGDQAFCYHVLLRRVPRADALTSHLYPARIPKVPHCNQPLLERARRALEPALRQYLRERLPPYLQPATVVLLEHFPVTSNGKVDREALPVPVAGLALDEATLSPTQRRLRALWAELLGTAEIAPDDNFYALGGDSLSAVRLLDSIHREFSVEIDFAEMLQSPTLARLAERIDLAGAQRALHESEGAAMAGERVREVLRL